MFCDLQHIALRLLRTVGPCVPSCLVAGIKALGPGHPGIVAVARLPRPGTLISLAPQISFHSLVLMATLLML